MSDHVFYYFAGTVNYIAISLWISFPSFRLLSALNVRIGLFVYAGLSISTLSWIAHPTFALAYLNISAIGYFLCLLVSIWRKHRDKVAKLIGAKAKAIRDKLVSSIPKARQPTLNPT